MFILPAALRRSRPRSARTIAALAGAAASLALIAGPALAAPATGTVESVIVKVDHAKVVRLPEKAQTVIVGNPAIADVAVQ
ncbi:MAG: pilus assembly protein N-terminal domain-containing protein, partial [Bosea sp. (in: a-proteobacteria)]|nr:pilus assembly protein N-terminal domain-containing protein [Bosea sp. (in: a-proteobacteria)]